MHFLKNFYDAILELSASKTHTSHLISISMFAIQIEIEKIGVKVYESSMMKTVDHEGGNLVWWPKP